MKKGKCNICKKPFTYKKDITLIGKLGPIPIDLCVICYPILMEYDELTLNDKRGK